MHYLLVVTSWFWINAWLYVDLDTCKQAAEALETSMWYVSTECIELKDQHSGTQQH